jgi:penicillin-binding protein 2
MFGRRNGKRYTFEIEPDEVLLDARNLPQFDVHQFEGRLEKPIGRGAMWIVASVLIVAGLAFSGKLIELQLIDGSAYVARAEHNRLRHTPIFPARGVIVDRNGTELVWNEPGEDFPVRKYIDAEGFGHLLGYVRYPEKDNNGFYYRRDTEGVTGVEQMYEDTLLGVQGVKLVEVDVHNEIVSENLMTPPEDGEELTLSIDARVQEALYRYIKGLMHQVGFNGGAGVIMDVRTGEIIALTSVPEYDSGIMSLGEDRETIASYTIDTRTPFLNRVISGLYAPGSTVKPFVAAAALEEGVIDEWTSIYSSGALVIPNPYGGPDSVFKDWKAFERSFTVREAIAWSSDVYFYTVGGGVNGRQGLGIARIKSYSQAFGLDALTNIDMPGEVAGEIPDVAWKEEHFPGDPWRVGNTYHTSIGQYGYQMTPIELVRGIAAIANGGTLVSPHVALTVGGESATPKGEEKTVPISPDILEIVQEGMRQGVTEGTALGANTPYVSVAAKTGTAELGVSKNNVNSWVTGFFPYEHPRYAFVVVMERGPHTNLVGATYVIRQTLDWMGINTPEYFEE